MKLAIGSTLLLMLTLKPTELGLVDLENRKPELNGVIGVVEERQSKDNNESPMEEPIFKVDDVVKPVLSQHNIEYKDDRVSFTHKPIEDEIKYEILEEIEDKTVYENDLFNPYDITEISNLTVNEIEGLLPDNLKSLAKCIYKLEHPDNDELSLNAILIIAQIKLESGNGESRLTKEKNNFLGIGARGEYLQDFSNTTIEDSHTSAWKNYGEYFCSLEDCLDRLRNLYLNHYLVEEGTDYRANGSSIWDINKKYCELTDYANKWLTVADNLICKLEERNNGEIVCN